MKILSIVLLSMFILLVSTWANEPQNLSEEQVPTGPLGMRFPAYSPDGNWIAFSYQGDIWKMPSQGGKAIRLTLHHADDVKPRFSPDGKQIAFSSNRSGNFDVWVIATEGGIPKQITVHSAWDSICDWLPDGNSILFSSLRSGAVELWKTKLSGGTPIQLTFDGGRDGVVSPDGKTMAYCRGDISLWIKGYQGTSNFDIYTLALDKNDPPIRRTTQKNNELFPFFSANGLEIYYTQENIVTKGEEKIPVYNLWRINANGQKTQVTQLESDIIAPYPSANRQKIIFEYNFKIAQFDINAPTPSNTNAPTPPPPPTPEASPANQPAIIPIEIVADDKGESELVRMISDGNEMAHWSPDSREIAFALRGDIWIMPAVGGKARQITKGAFKEQWPRFSPDGKYLAYVSDKSGNDDIYILNLKTNEEKQLTTDKASDFFQSWSPDSKSLVFTSERSGNRDIWLVNATDGMVRQITDASGSEDDAVFSPDGQWLAFDSNKSGNQEIWIMPAQGQFSEAVQLTENGGLTQVPSWSPNSQFVAYEHNDDEGNSSIWMISKTGGKPMQVLSGGSMPCWSPDGKWLLYEKTTDDDIKMTMKMPAPQDIQYGEPLSFFAEVKTDPQQDRAQAFEESWNAINNGFYDPKFHGVDWEKVKKNYRPLLDHAKTDMELEVLVNRMVGELKSSHMGISSNRDDNKVTTGYLGCSFVRPTQYRVLQVKNVIPDGPADKAWIRNNDFVFEIAGERTIEDLNLDQLLNGTVGKEVKLYVGPTIDPYQGRYVTLTPVDLQEIDKLQYQQWVRTRVQMVKEGCEGKVLYFHLREMNDVNLKRFRQAVQKTADIADGMILDVRNNGGGNIHQELLDILTRKPFLMYQMRNQKKQLQPTLYWNKPVVLLVNEKSFSDAEVFPYAFKILKLGVIVGAPTGGGVIGTRDITLSNSMEFRVPQVGYYTLEETNMEGLGVEPDIIVEETPQDRLDGTDPQLLKAIEIINQQIANAE